MHSDLDTISSVYEVELDIPYLVSTHPGCLISRRPMTVRTVQVMSERLPEHTQSRSTDTVLAVAANFSTQASKEAPTNKP